MRPADRVMNWNALAGRYAFSQLRPRNFAITLGIYGSALAVIALGLLLQHAWLAGLVGGKPTAGRRFGGAAGRSDALIPIRFQRYNVAGIITIKVLRNNNEHVIWGLVFSGWEVAAPVLVSRIIWTARY